MGTASRTILTRSFVPTGSLPTEGNEPVKCAKQTPQIVLEASTIPATFTGRATVILNTQSNDAAFGIGTSPVLVSAREYLGRGWSVIPIAAGTKKPPKRFRWRQFQERQPTEQELREWFTDRDDLGIAVVLGKVSDGLVSRDFDNEESYRRWKRAHADLAQMLPTVQTQRGFHVYFRAPDKDLVFRDLRPAQDGEYRGDSRHYCILPPSRHTSGSIYEWFVPLPEGEVPFIEDVVAAGFFSAPHVTQKAQGTHKKSQVIINSCSPGIERRRLSDNARIVIEDAISRTIPDRPGTRRRKIMELARTLKFHPEFAGTTAAQLNFLRSYLNRWWQQAKPHTSGKHPNFNESWQDFVFAWEEARFPVGATMRQFMEVARSLPAPKKAAELYGEGTFKAILASLCSVLQEHAGDKPFPLSGRIVAPLLGVSDVHAWRWIKTLEKDGLVKAAKIHPKGRRLATEWIYLGG